MFPTHRRALIQHDQGSYLVGSPRASLAHFCLPFRMCLPAFRVKKLFRAGLDGIAEATAGQESSLTEKRYWWRHSDIVDMAGAPWLLLLHSAARLLRAPASVSTARSERHILRTFFEV